MKLIESKYLDEIESADLIFKSGQIKLAERKKPRLLYVYYSPSRSTYFGYLLFLIAIVFIIYTICREVGVSIENSVFLFFFLGLAVFCIRGIIVIRKVLVVFTTGKDSYFYYRKYGVLGSKIDFHEDYISQKRLSSIELQKPTRKRGNLEYGIKLIVDGKQTMRIAYSNLEYMDAKICVEEIREFLGSTITVVEKMYFIRN